MVNPGPYIFYPVVDDKGTLVEFIPDTETPTDVYRDSEEKKLANLACVKHLEYIDGKLMLVTPMETIIIKTSFERKIFEMYSTAESSTIRIKKQLGIETQKKEKKLALIGQRHQVTIPTKYRAGRATRNREKQHRRRML